MLQHQLLPLPLLRFLAGICSSFQTSTFVLGIKLLEFFLSLLFSHQLKMKSDFVTMAAVLIGNNLLEVSEKSLGRWANWTSLLHLISWHSRSASYCMLWTPCLWELTINRMTPDVVYDFTSFTVVTSEWNNSSPNESTFWTAVKSGRAGLIASWPSPCVNIDAYQQMKLQAAGIIIICILFHSNPCSSTRPCFLVLPQLMKTNWHMQFHSMTCWESRTVAVASTSVLLISSFAWLEPFDITKRDKTLPICLK